MPLRNLLPAAFRQTVWMLVQNIQQPSSHAAASFRTSWRALVLSAAYVQQPAAGKSVTTARASTVTAAKAVSTRSITSLHHTEGHRAAAQSMVASIDGSGDHTAASSFRSSTVAGATAALPVVQATAAGSSLQQGMKQQQQQQQQSACTYSTQLLVLDPAELPPVTTPSAAAVQQISAGAHPPSLSRESCPHLYYSLPVQQAVTSSVAAADVAASDGCSSSAQQTQAALCHAAQLLQQDLPVAIPTETVYGLAGNALSTAAVTSIFEAKGRPSDNPLIVHISDLDMLYQLYPEHLAAGTNPVPQQYHKLIAAFWPGPLTILLPTSPLIPAAVTAGQPTVAVRMPAHPAARALIAAAGVPLAAPSANTSGKPSPTTAQHVLEDLSGRVPAVVDGGACGFGVESTVLDGLRGPPVVLRPGGVTAEQLSLAPEMAGLQVYSRDFTDKALEANPTTPGMKYRHYSPTAPVLLLDPTPAWQALQQQYSSMSEQRKQYSSQQLEQAVAAETQELLQKLQQQEQPQLLVLLSTCRSSRDGCEAEMQCGWTPCSLQHIQQEQQEQGLLHAGTAASLANDGNGCSCDLCASKAGSTGHVVLEYILGSIHKPKEVAKELFAALRAADRVGCDLIVVQGVLPVDAGMAVMNRLQKAASQRHLVSNV